MVIQYLPIAMIGLAILQSVLLLCILVQVRRSNKQLPKATQPKPKEPVVVHSTDTAAPILPWLRNTTRDDMIDSFRVLAKAQQNERNDHGILE